MEDGKRNISFKYAFNLRTLAFELGLPYAPWVFPETDNHLRRRCPTCGKEGFVPHIPKSIEWNADYFIKTFCETEDEI